MAQKPDWIGENELESDDWNFSQTDHAQSTRTAALDNGVSMRWTADDRIALWATSGSGWTLSNQPFTLHYGLLDPSEAFFTATIEPMPQNTYTYHALSPVPESVAGNTACFTLQSVQDAATVWNNDILQSEPTTASQLGTKLTSDLNLSMKHRMHALRFFMQQGDNPLTDPVEKIVMQFADNVVGTVAVDLTDPNVEPTLTNGTSRLTVTIPDGLHVSTSSLTDYAYALIFPIAQQGGQITIKVYSSTERGTLTRSQKEFLAGHITPVRLSFDTAEPLTKLRFKLAANNLGENPHTLTISTADQSNLTDDSSSITVATASTFYSSGYYELDVTDVADLSGKRLNLGYESENALVSQSIVLPSIARNATTDIALTVPYLFFEDFASVASFNSNDNYATSSAGSKSATSFLNGWTGGRIGAQANTAIRIACRRETSADYPARVDSAPLVGIKAGKTVNLSVSFNYGMNRQEGGIGSAPLLGQTCYMGFVTSPTAYASGDTTGTYGDNFYVNQTTGSYTSLPNSHTFNLNDCGNTTRLSWRTENDHKVGLTNGTFWLYIDNIKVKIKQ